MRQHGQVVVPVGIHHDALLASIGHCHCISSKVRLVATGVMMLLVVVVSRPGLMLNYGTMMVMLMLVHCLLQLILF